MDNTATIPCLVSDLQDEIIIFHVGGFPTFAFMDGRLWISLSRLWEALGPLARGLALDGHELRILNDADGGAFMELDDFAAIMPADVRTTLRTQERRLMSMIHEREDGEQ